MTPLYYCNSYIIRKSRHISFLTVTKRNVGCRHAWSSYEQGTPTMSMKTKYASRALVVLGLFVASIAMLPVLGMVLLGVLTLLVPAALLLAPVLFALVLVFLVGRVRSI